MNFSSVSAIIEKDVSIGSNSMVWYFAHLMEGARVGENCTIGERTFIGKKVIIGNNVKIGNGANVYEGAVIKDNVFIGNNVSFTNVKYPRAWRKAREILPVIVEEGSTINANAVICGGVHIGKNSTVGEGAVVVHDVAEGGFVISPAAECICEREECKECSKRREKKLKKHQKYVARNQEA